MNDWQMAQQIKAVLEALTWPDGGDLVFGAQGNVVVHNGQPTEDQITESLPAALVLVADGEFDEEDPDIIRQGYTILAAAQVAGDPMGEFAVIGGAAPDLDESAGRGAMELMTQVRGAVADLTGANGAKIILGGTAGGGPQLLGQGRHLAWTTLDLEAIVTSQLAYAAPQHFANAAGTWTWEGAHCSDRFDFVQYRMGYAASQPETPADLSTVVYTGTAATASHTAVIGQFYAVFADYSARGQAGVVEGSSSGTRVGATIAT